MTSLIQSVRTSTPDRQIEPQQNFFKLMQKSTNYTRKFALDTNNVVSDEEPSQGQGFSSIFFTPPKEEMEHQDSDDSFGNVNIFSNCWNNNYPSDPSTHSASGEDSDPQDQQLFTDMCTAIIDSDNEEPAAIQYHSGASTASNDSPKSTIVIKKKSRRGRAKFVEVNLVDGTEAHANKKAYKNQNQPKEQVLPMATVAPQAFANSQFNQEFVPTFTPSVQDFVPTFEAPEVQAADPLLEQKIVNIQKTLRSKGKSKKGNNHLEKVGDWFCKYCKNVNFSFRKSCNKCKQERASHGSTIECQDQLLNVFTRKACAMKVDIESADFVPTL